MAYCLLSLQRALVIVAGPSSCKPIDVSFICYFSVVGSFAFCSCKLFLAHWWVFAADKLSIVYNDSSIAVSYKLFVLYGAAATQTIQTTTMTIVSHLRPVLA